MRATDRVRIFMRCLLCAVVHVMETASITTRGVASKRNAHARAVQCTGGTRTALSQARRNGGNVWRVRGPAADDRERGRRTPAKKEAGGVVSTARVREWRLCWPRVPKRARTGRKSARAFGGAESRPLGAGSYPRMARDHRSTARHFGVADPEDVWCAATTARPLSSRNQHVRHFSMTLKGPDAHCGQIVNGQISRLPYRSNGRRPRVRSEFPSTPARAYSHARPTCSQRTWPPRRP